MAVLIGILLPSIASVQESARRVICQSNMKQIGLGITMFAEDNGNLIPSTVYGNHENYEQLPTEMMQLHLGDGEANNWDGLGFLMEDEHITAEGVFYCPSHKGYHGLEEYQDEWRNLGDEIVGNYNYRPVADYERDIAKLDARTVLVTDGLRTTLDYSHVTGNNALNADISVSWYNDEFGYLMSLLPETDQGVFGGDYGAAVVWQMLDEGEAPEGLFNTPGSSGNNNDHSPSKLDGPSAFSLR